VDRTDGANPIRQQLDNLNEAGTLYGAIIYQKAPIVMQQLERLVGDETMRVGLRQYLADFQFGNATWPDLIEILDRLSPEDLRSWSRVWVEAPGRPTLAADVRSARGRIEELTVTQSDPRGRGLSWTQRFDIILGVGDSVQALSVQVHDSLTVVAEATGLPEPDYVLLGGDGLGYGRFQLDLTSRNYLVNHLAAVPDPMVRSTGWMALWETVLYHELEPLTFVTSVLAALPQETNEQVVQQLLEVLETAYWNFVTETERSRLARGVEDLLWSLIDRRDARTEKTSLYNAYVSMALTPTGISRLENLWRGDLQIPDLPLAERQYTALAEALGVRDVPGSSGILVAQLDRIDNPDRRERFAFILPSLSADHSVRDSVFASLADDANRKHESWVLAVLANLHHPLRAAEAEPYIVPSLELLEEIQRTGDIFFPLRWLRATLGGHRSPTAANAVRAFLNERPNYPPRLRAKILQAADLLFRTAHSAATGGS
jgi:aminopeptidase N